MIHVLHFDGTKNTELTRARRVGTLQVLRIVSFFVSMCLASSALFLAKMMLGT